MLTANILHKCDIVKRSQQFQPMHNFSESYIGSETHKYAVIALQMSKKYTIFNVNCNSEYILFFIFVDEGL